MSHPIPLDILTDHLAVLAKTGAGKTYLAKGLVERLLHEKRRVCIVDPKNAWWGLKSSADGKKEAFSIVVFGGPNADVPLLANHGKVLGEAVATGHMSCIICTKGMLEGDRIKFLLDFFETLNMKNSEPLHLVLDEAHMMAPQKPLGDMQRLTHWTSELVSGGRGMGFRVILLSQRPARLNKDVLTQCETLVAMRMTGPQDRDAVFNWIKDQADVEKGKEILASLPKLPNGEGWLWAPQRDILKRVKFPLIETYDNSKTKKDGVADKKAKLAPVDLSVLQDRLGKVKAEIDANDPKALKAEVAALRKQLATAKPTIVDKVMGFDTAHVQAACDEAHRKGWAAGVQASDKSWKAGVSEFRGRLEAALKDASKLVFSAPTLADNPHDIPRASNKQRIIAARGKPMDVLEASVSKPRTFNPNHHADDNAEPMITAGDFSGPETKIMRALARWQAFGFESPTRAQLGALAGYHPGGPSFTNPLGALRSRGLVDYGTGTVMLTQAGLECVTFERTYNAEVIHAKLRAVLDGPQTKIFEALLPHHTEPMTRVELGAAAGYHPGGPSFTNPLGALRSREIVDYGKGTVFLRPWVFGE